MPREARIFCRTTRGRLSRNGLDDRPTRSSQSWNRRRPCPDRNSVAAHRVADDWLGVNGQRTFSALATRSASRQTLGQTTCRGPIAVCCKQCRTVISCQRGPIALPVRYTVGVSESEIPGRQVGACLVRPGALQRGGEGLAHAGDAKQRSGHNGSRFSRLAWRSRGVDQTTVIGDGQGSAGRFVRTHEGGHQIVIAASFRMASPVTGYKPDRQTATRPTLRQP